MAAACNASEDDEESAFLSSIGEHEQQLVQLRAAHEMATDQSDRDDLLKLIGDMEQLIAMSKGGLKMDDPEALLSMKKKRMLREVDRLAGVDECPVSKIDAEVDGHVNDHLETVLGSLEGTLFQAPFGFEWGQRAYHNAVVLNVEPHDSIVSMDDVKVRVLFCNPTADAMKPCPYFLDGSCRFSDDQCRFSHGLVVPFGALLKFKDPNYGLLQRDAPCLAKYKDGLWYPAVVESVSDEDHMVTIKYKSYGHEATVELKDVIPQELDLSSSDSDDSTSDCSSDSETGLLPVPSSLAASQEFGHWEKHTRGIGSKLMAKMGYVLGTGLGKSGEGRIEPVAATMVPRGKSLDQIMAIKENAAATAAGQEKPSCSEKKRRQRTKRKLKAINDRYLTTAEDEKINVFGFINDRLASPQKESMCDVDRQTIERLATKQKLKEDTRKHLNTKSLKVSEDIRRAEQELLRYRAALARNQSSDKMVAMRYKEKIVRQEEAIRCLKDYEGAIQGEQRSRNSDRKLTVF